MWVIDDKSRSLLVNTGDLEGIIVWEKIVWGAIIVGTIVRGAIVKTFGFLQDLFYETFGFLQASSKFI